MRWVTNHVKKLLMFYLKLKKVFKLSCCVRYIDFIVEVLKICQKTNIYILINRSKPNIYRKSKFIGYMVKITIEENNGWAILCSWEWKVFNLKKYILVVSLTKWFYHVQTGKRCLLKPKRSNEWDDNLWELFGRMRGSFYSFCHTI